jgi:hypothetical protein
MEPERPNIQIDDLVRPMTDDEYAVWLEEQANYVPAPWVVTDGD